MTKVTLYFNKSIEENAAMYFEDGKKAKRKVKGVKETLAIFEKKKDDVDVSEHKSQIKHLDNSKTHWFEKFKWFITSDGFLVVAGRDATTNEIVIKKHTSKNDLVFHTDMAGSPFVVIKNDRSDVSRLLGDYFNSFFKPNSDKIKTIDFPLDDYPFSRQTIFEASCFTAIHSKAWKIGLGSSDVFFVKPDQVSKEANSGEFMAKGSFMIRGDTTYVEPLMDFAVGLMKTVDDYIVLSGPLDAIKANCEFIVIIEQGTQKASVVAKSVAKYFKEKYELGVSIDDIIKNLPSGGCQIKRVRKRKSEL